MSPYRIFKRFAFVFCIVILTFAFCILHLEKAQATSAFSVSVNPPIIYVRALPPAKVETPITITNHSESPITLTISLKPFTQAGEFGEVSLEDTPSPIEPLVKILDEDKVIKDIKLSPNESRDLLFSLDIPNGISVQDYYFSIIFQTKHTLVPQTLQDKEKKENTVQAFSRLFPGIATNVLLSIGPWERGNVHAQFLSKAFYESGPVDFHVRVTNGRKSAVPIQGEILIKNLFGQSVGKIDLSSQYLLAQGSKTYPRIAWEERLLIGPYRATLVLTSSNNEPLLTREMLFFAAPYRVLTGTIVFLVLLLWTISRIKKKVHFS